jgi:hypothetical protein
MINIQGLLRVGVLQHQEIHFIGKLFLGSVPDKQLVFKLLPSE